MFPQFFTEPPIFSSQLELMKLLEANDTILFCIWATVKKMEVPIDSSNSLIKVANKLLEFEKSSIKIV